MAEVSIHRVRLLSRGTMVHTHSNSHRYTTTPPPPCSCIAPGLVLEVLGAMKNKKQTTLLTPDMGNVMCFKFHFFDSYQALTSPTPSH